MFENENARRKHLNSVEEGDMAEFRDMLNLDRRISQLFQTIHVDTCKVHLFVISFIRTGNIFSSKYCREKIQNFISSYSPLCPSFLLCWIGFLSKISFYCSLALSLTFGNSSSLASSVWGLQLWATLFKVFKIVNTHTHSFTLRANTFHLIIYMHICIFFLIGIIEG